MIISTNASLAGQKKSKNDIHTKLLLHAEDFTDSSYQNMGISSYNVTLSTSDKKFGTTSFFFNGSNAYITFPQGTINWGSGDFTIEWWENCSTFTNNGTRFCSERGSPGYCGIFLGYSTGNSTYATTNTSSWNLINGANMIYYTANTWVHWAFVRKNGVLHSYRNGVLYQSASCAGVLHQDNNRLMQLGTYNSGSNSFGGFIDEFRISDIARYDGNFTPPSEPFTA